MPLQATALLTHLHYDHVLGLPFFSPMRDPGAVLDIYGPSQEGGSLHDVLAGLVAAARSSPSTWPSSAASSASTTCEGLGGVRRRGHPGQGAADPPRRPHPGLPHRGRRAVGGLHLRPPGPPRPPDGGRSSVLELCEGADLVIHDAQYTDDEFADPVRLGPLDGGLRRPGGRRGGGPAASPSSTTTRPTPTTRSTGCSAHARTLARRARRSRSTRRGRGLVGRPGEGTDHDLRHRRSSRRP